MTLLQIIAAAEKKIISIRIHDLQFIALAFHFFTGIVEKSQFESNKGNWAWFDCNLIAVFKTCVLILGGKCEENENLRSIEYSRKITENGLNANENSINSVCWSLFE